MSYSFYKKKDKYITSHSTFGLRSPLSTYPDVPSRFGSDLDSYTLTSPNLYGNSIYDNIIDRTINRHRDGNDCDSANSTATSSAHRFTSSASPSAHRFTPASSASAHRFTSTASSSAHRFTSTASSSAHRFASADSSSTHRSTSTTSNRSKYPDDLCTLAPSLYQDAYSNDSIGGLLKRTPATSTSTIGKYITINATENRYRDRTTPTLPSFHQQEKDDESIESYIMRMERKKSLEQPEQSTILRNQPTYNPPATSVRPLSLDNWMDPEIPKTTEMTTMTKTMRFERSKNRSPSLFHSDAIINLLSDGEGDENNDDELHDTRTSNQYTRSLESGRTVEGLITATSATSIHESHSELRQQRRKRRKMDNDGSLVESKSQKVLEFDELFGNYKKSHKPKVKQQTKYKDKTETVPTGLVNMLLAISSDIGQGTTDLDKKQELAFFEDETPKDNGQKSKQSLVNGFNGFSDDDLDDEQGGL